jgi:hypothetical protein
MRLSEANSAVRRRDLEIIGEFPALPASPEKPTVVRQAAVFRIYPNQAQERAFRQWAGAGRWFWNKCVEINQQLYAREGRFAFHGELSALLPQMKAADGWNWLKEPPAIHLVDVSRRFDKALRDFLDDRWAVHNGREAAARPSTFPSSSPSAIGTSRSTFPARRSSSSVDRPRRPTRRAAGSNCRAWTRRRFGRA